MRTYVLYWFTAWTLLLTQYCFAEPNDSGTAGRNHTNSNIAPVEMANWQFDDPNVENRAHRLYHIAQELSRPSWNHNCLEGRNAILKKWKVWWGSPGLEISDSGSFTPSTTPMSGEALHFIELSAFRRRSAPDTIELIRLHSYRRPQLEGWSASVNYVFHYSYSHYPSGYAFDFSFTYRASEDAHPTGRNKSLSLGQELTRLRVARVFEDTKYYAGASIDKKECFQTKVTDDQLTCWYASPESFLDAGLSRLDQLKRNFSGAVESGKAISAFYIDGSKSKFRIPGSRSSAVPKGSLSYIRFVALRPAPKASNRPLSTNEFQQLIEDVERQIECRKTLLRQNYKQMHAALVDAFPLHHCLE